MNFIKHSELEGLHAVFGASKYHWLNYNDDKMLKYYKETYVATMKGTKLHEIAKMCIEEGIKLKGTNTLAMFVNDAIGFNMKPEQVLVYSVPYFFGTADAISFKNNKLRIHDLKTGKTPVHMEQLYIYAALFCLEYEISPKDITICLRIYQNNDIWEDNPTPEIILPVMDKIVHSNKLLKEVEEK